jgi:hypothetical protein
MNVISRFKALTLIDKGNVIRATPNEGIWGSGFTAPLIIDLCYKWKWVVSFTSRLICPPPPFGRRKTPCFWLKRRLGGPQRRCSRFEEEKIICVFGFPSNFDEALSRLGCFVLSFGRFLRYFSVDLMENYRPWRRSCYDSAKRRHHLTQGHSVAIHTTWIFKRNFVLTRNLNTLLPSSSL